MNMSSCRPSTYNTLATTCYATSSINNEEENKKNIDQAPMARAPLKLQAQLSHNCPLVGSKEHHRTRDTKTPA